METPKSETDREGRILAHRMVLETLLREAAARSDDPDRFWSMFEQLYQFQDHEEDPGVVTSEAYGVEATAALEMRRLVEGARGKGD